MPSKPLDFLDVAKDIKKISNEAAYRTVVSRAYYACYHYSQDMALILDDAEGNGMHVRHINKFIEAQNMKTKGIGYQLRQFHGMRIDADYELDMKFPEGKAEIAISMAERIIEDIDKIS